MLTLTLPRIKLTFYVPISDHSDEVLKLMYKTFNLYE